MHDTNLSFLALFAAALLENTYLAVFAHLQAQAGGGVVVGRAAGAEQDGQGIAVSGGQLES